MTVGVNSHSAISHLAASTVTLNSLTSVAECSNLQQLTRDDRFARVFFSSAGRPSSISRLDIESNLIFFRPNRAVLVGVEQRRAAPEGDRAQSQERAEGPPASALVTGRRTDRQTVPTRQ